MKYSLSAGDIFRFGNIEEGWGFGQILISDMLQFIVIFEPRFANRTSVHEVVSSKPLLSGWTMDAMFYSGEWQVVGNTAPIEFNLPNFKVESSGQTWVTDVNGAILRLAHDEDIARLSYKSSNSPIAFENAFRAHHGSLPWTARFDELRVPGNYGGNWG